MAEDGDQVLPSKQGMKALYAQLATRLNAEGYHVVIPDYTKYPKGTLESMCRDVKAALTWTLLNIRFYGGDPNNVMIMGHDAGSWT
jgi:acetyl esterase/lipase